MIIHDTHLLYMSRSRLLLSNNNCFFVANKPDPILTYIKIKLIRYNIHLHCLMSKIYEMMIETDATHNGSSMARHIRTLNLLTLHDNVQEMLETRVTVYT